MDFQTIVTVVLLIAFAAWVLVTNGAVKEVARWVAGVSAIVLALLFVLPLA